jgi:hypothetical protein
MPMQVFLTIISGTTVFILGQLVLKLVIEPVQEFRNVIADISIALFEYENIYANPGYVNTEASKKASESLRKLASNLNAKTHLIPFYSLTAKLFNLPLQVDIFDSVRNLIGISNGIFSTAHNKISEINIEKANKIRHILSITSFTQNND